MGVFEFVRSVFSRSSRWEAADAERHTKLARTERLQRLWAYVANDAVQRDGDRGAAVLQANGVVRKTLRAAFDHRVIRDPKPRREFLIQSGYPGGKLPHGFHVDHKEPLRSGGHHHPSNMQVLTEAQHRRKTVSDLAMLREMRKRLETKKVRKR